jgi:hypothetical protein
MAVSLQVQCAECHPEHGLRCQLNLHPATIKHYAVRFQSPMEFYTWASDEELAVWPEPPRSVRLVTTDGDELPVELIYLGEVDGVTRWATSPPCNRELAGVRIGAYPSTSSDWPNKCTITIDRGTR